MSRLIHPVWLLNSLLLVSLLSNGVQAQISADGTLSTTVSSTDQRNFVINGGDRAGGNLFHSFRTFSVPTGGSAYFNNAADVQNIFTRVTGGNVSNIDGLIRANGTANLFLLNPNGILFGANAALNIGGSFIGSTANRLRFSDGTTFSAVSPSTVPLLTVSVPVGLQLGTNPGSIQVNGLGNQEIVPTTNFGLAVAPGHTLALVGGNVTFNGGIATAAAGRLEVGSVAQGEVSLTPSPVGWALGYGQVDRFGDAQFLNRSSLWLPVSNAAGSIQVQAGRVVLNNSQIAATSGASLGGNIVIHAADLLELTGVNSIYPFSSWIVNQVTPGASGSSGQIQVNTPQLTLRDGSRIQTLSQGSGAAGAIRVNADSVSISGASPASASPEQQDLFHSRITSDVLATGNGGNIRISARQIALRHGGQISSLVAPQATGHGGNIFVHAAGTIAAIGVDSLHPATNSGFSSATVGAGAGGDLRISGDRFILLDGGVLQSLSLGTGRGGDITARANHTITARRPNFSLLGGIGSYTLGAADGGNIWVSTDHLGLYEGASIASASISRSANDSGVASGNSGNITVNARQSIRISGVSRSPISPSTIGIVTTTSGNAGNVTVSTRRLLLDQGGALASGTLFEFAQGFYTGIGTGNGGNVRVNASESITVRGVDLGTALPAALNTFTVSRGNAGDTVIQTPRLTVQDGGLLGSLNAAAGKAGRVMIDATSILVSGTAVNGAPAQIFSTARIPEARIRRSFNILAMPAGDTGTLSLNAHHITVAAGGVITVQHQGVGNAGQLTVNTETLDMQNQGQITAATAAGEGGNVRLNIQDVLFMRDRSQISTTAGGMGSGGNIEINSPFLIGLENSDIVARAQAGTGGNISITANSVLGIAPRSTLTPDSDINASSQLGLNGSITISNLNIKPDSGLAELPENVVDASQQVAATCAATQASRFVATGRGGIPENPTQRLDSDRVWQDLRDLSSFTAPVTEVAAVDPANPVEATNWRQDAQGQIELVAIASPSQLHRVETCAAASP